MTTGGHGLGRPAMAGLFMASLIGCATSRPLSPDVERRGSRDEVTVALEGQLPQMMQEADVPGLSLALIRPGRAPWIRAFGYRTTVEGPRVTDDTIFEAASLSKPVFAYAVLKLVDQGLLDLDAPLENYLPDPDIAGDARSRSITARIVLSHRTGLPNWRRGEALALHFSPGQRFSYSGEGYIYLQKVVEHITGKALNDFMIAAVFEPLGMSDSSYVWEPAFDRCAATGHGVSPKMSVDKWRPREARAASSLHTTARDYARFISAILTGTGLSARSLALMETPEISVDPECVTNCFRRAPAPLSTEVSWGLGWGVESSGGRRALWHWGDNGSFKAYAVVYPEEKSALVMFTNSANGLGIAGAVIRTAFGDEQAGLRWLNVDAYDSASARFARAIESEGAALAIKTFEDELKRGEISAKSADAIGRILMDEDKFADALQVMHRILELNPGFADGHTRLGQAYEATGDKASADLSYRAALRLDPEDSDARHALARLAKDGN